MNDQHAPQEIEALIREVARLEQIVAEKKFDASRAQSPVDLGYRAKQKI